MRNLPKLACVLLFLLGCDGEPDEVDAGPPPTDAGAPGPILPLCEETEPGPALEHADSTLVASISIPERLAEPGTANPATERGEVMYRGLGYADVSRGPGVERVLRTDLGGAAPPATGRRSIAWFVHYSDFQLADDESPLRLALTDNPGLGGGLRAQEAYLPRAVSAMNRTLSRLERTERPFDFGIITGDCADSAQTNELRWVIELMNGQPGLHTDSGEDDDPVPGPGNDPKDPFDPVPFPAPWLYVPGNHDLLIVGVSLPDDSTRERAVGDTPTGSTRDWTSRWGGLTSRSVPADPERALIDRAQIVEALRADEDGPGPVGHGYPDGADLSVGANYAYDAVDGLLRMIVLDTTDDTGGSEGLVHRATVDEFLVPEIERAEADGMLAIVASHHSTPSIDVYRGQLGSEAVADAVPPEELESIVASHANVIAWLVGHSHDNRVRPIAGPDADHPGYWEIMAPAMADYPGQARLTEIVDNGDGTLSIFSTLLDFDEDDCMEQRFRRLLVMEYVTAWSDLVSTAPEDLNVELVRAVPPSAAANVTAATGHDRIESETTLRGM